MWMDTSIRLKHIDPYFKKAKRYGIQVLHGSGSILVRTHQRLFETLNEKQCMVNYPEIQAGLIIITRSCLTLTYIMRPWVPCALQYECMDIPNAENYYDCTNEWILSSCHRSDQSVLRIILTRLFNQRRHQFIIEQDFGNVCRDCPQNSFWIIIVVKNVFMYFFIQMFDISRSFTIKKVNFNAIILPNSCLYIQRSSLLSIIIDPCIMCTIKTFYSGSCTYCTMYFLI